MSLNLYKYKNVFILFAVLVISLIVYEIYLYNEHGGNLVIYVSNQSSDEPDVDILILLDDSEILNESFTFGSGHGWEKYTICTSVGAHKINIQKPNSKTPLVLIKMQLLQKHALDNKNKSYIIEKFNLFFVRFVIIEYYGDNKFSIDYKLYNPSFL